MHIPFRESCLICLLQLPIGNASTATEVSSRVSVTNILDDGFTIPETIGRVDNDATPMVIKANTLLAATSKIDDDRMMKVQQEGDFTTMHTYLVRERERKLGLPEGSAENAGAYLFWL